MPLARRSPLPLVSGELEYHKAESTLPGFAVRPGMVVWNYPGEPHYGEFVEDSWLIEFKYGPNSAVGQWENVEYEPFRKIVRERMDS